MANLLKIINDYKLEMIRLWNDTNLQPAPDVTDSSQTSVKSVLHHQVNDLTPICQITETPYIWCQSPSVFQNTTFDRGNDLLHFYHAHHSVITSTAAIKDRVFLPDKPLQGSCNSFTVYMCLFPS